MTGYNSRNQMTPSDVDLFATLTMLTRRHAIDYGILHTCTLDSMGHRFGHDCHEMDHAVYAMDGMLAAFLPGWRQAGYEVIVTADHGQTDRGHHGGHDDEMQDFALYYFGEGKGPEADTLLDQLQLAPTVLKRLGVAVPETMKAKPFLGGEGGRRHDETIDGFRAEALIWKDRNLSVLPASAQSLRRSQALLPPGEKATPCWQHSPSSVSFAEIPWRKDEPFWLDLRLNKQEPGGSTGHDSSDRD